MSLRRVSWLFFAILLLAALASAQSFDCKAFINDGAGVISNPSVVDQGAKPLVDQGADVRVITVASLSQYGSRLEDVEKAYEASCPDVKEANGNRKTNLFVILLAPNDKKKNVFFGEAYVPVFDTSAATEIYSKYANPYFRNGKWGEGIAAALQGYASGVQAFRDESKHPVVAGGTTVNEAPTDWKPIVSFLKWLLLIGVVGGVIFFIYFLVRKKKEQEEEANAAQQEAVAAQQDCIDEFNRLAKDTPNYDGYADRFQRLSQSLSYDPNEGHLTADGYRAIAAVWTKLAGDMRYAGVKPVKTEQSYYRPKKRVSPKAEVPSFQNLHEEPTHLEQNRFQPSTVVVHQESPRSSSIGDALIASSIINSAAAERERDEERRAERRREEKREEERRAEQRRRDDDDRRRREEDSYSSSSSSSSSDSSFGFGGFGGGGSDSSFGFGGGGGGGSDSSW